MNKIFRIFYCLILSSLGLVSCVNDSNGPVKEPVDYVDPYIGNISHLLVPTFPTVQLPNSMLRVYPERADYTSEYLNGLPVIVTNHRERSAFKLSVTTGEVDASVIPVSYDNEHITPYSFDVLLADGAIKAAKLNGKPLDAPFISHEDIMNGGRLEFEMTDRPVKDCFK